MTAGRIVDEYDTWLALRLVQVADTLRDSGDLARRTGFADAWAAFETWPAGAVRRASRHPLLDRWVGTAERLVAAGVHQRYPAAHPTRHLRDFARLLLAWAEDAPEGAEGRVPLLGRRCFPLRHGRCLLRTDHLQVDGALRWRRTGRALRVSSGPGALVAEIDLDGSASPVVAPGWSLVVVPDVAGVLVDGWTPEYGGDGLDPGDGAEPARVQAALGELPGQSAALVAAVGRALVVRPAGTTWTAGLLDVRGPLVGPDQVARAAYRDLWLRWATLSALWLASAPPASPLSDLRASLAEQGADRYVSELRAGRDPGTGPADLWPVPAAPADPEPERHDQGGRLVLLGAGAAGVDLPGALTLTKTRRAHHGDLDWSAANALASRTDAEVRRYLEHALAAAPGESAAFSAAIAAYVLGEWTRCLSLLERCLVLDEDVEEYRYLRAFALRHAGRPDAFVRAVFGEASAPADLVEA